MTSTKLNSTQSHRDTEAQRNWCSLCASVPLWLCSSAVER